MKTSLLDALVCPKCSSAFHIKNIKKRESEIIEGTLVCAQNHKFKVINGIPRFVFDTSKSFAKTEDAFSSKWKKYHKSYHEKEWFEFQRNWFLERFGWHTLSKFNKFLESRKKILDAGTGIGNSARFLSNSKNAQVFALDASESIDFAYKKYGHIENVHFLQADLRKLPFRKNFFDYIYSDQVLHHTKNTETSFKYLTKFLQKNGLISIYVYNKKAPIREFADDYIRTKTTKMSEAECVEFSKDMTILGKSLSRLKKKITIPRDISLLNIKAGTYDVQRFIYWHFLKCFWADDEDFERSVGVNFDWYYPKYAYRHTPDEVRKWYADTKTKIIHFKEIESGISATGKKL
ncbi:MAG TPA: class I SAM-dependent methyltransferase [Nitrosopumilaceae archaeon]|nr:class I SAM-dependent methyltransferase [Nitrosopumilaceae archaeon]